MWLYHRVMSPSNADGMANSVDPDQTAPPGAVWSGSALFAQTYLSKNLGSLRYQWWSEFMCSPKKILHLPIKHPSTRYYRMNERHKRISPSENIARHLCWWPSLYEVVIQTAKQDSGEPYHHVALADCHGRGSLVCVGIKQGRFLVIHCVSVKFLIVLQNKNKQQN